MGLLPVPGAACPQGPHQLLQAHQLGGERVSQDGQPQAGQVVRLDVAVEVVPGDPADGLVGQPEVLEDGDVQALGGSRALRPVHAVRP